MADPVKSTATTFDSKKIDYASTNTKRVEVGTATVSGASVEIDLANVTANWVAFVSIVDKGTETNPPVLTTALCGAGTITVTATGTSNNDATMQYIAIEL